MATPRIAFLECHRGGAALAAVTEEGGAIRWENVGSVAAGPESSPAQILRRLAALAGYRGPVIFLLPAAALLVKTLRLPALPSRRRAAARRFAAGQAIPYPLAEVVWEGVPAATAESEELLFAAREADVEAWCAAADSAGLQVETVWPAPLATLAAFRGVRPSPGPQLVLTTGTEVHELWQIDDTRVALRLLPAGGGPVDPDRLADDIRRTRAHFAGAQAVELADPVSLRLAAGPDAAELAGALESRLGLPVQIWRADGVTPPPGGQLRAASVLRLQGAARMARDAAQRRADLLPVARRRRLRWRREAPWWLAAAVLAWAAVVPPIIRLRTGAAELRGRIEASTHELQPMRAREAEFRAGERRWRALAAEIERFAQLERDRSRWVRLLADLQARLADVGDVWLDRLEPVAAGGDGESTDALRIAVSGRMLERARPLAPVDAETFARAQRLFATLAGAPQVAAVQGERLQREQPGILRFDCALALRRGEAEP